MTDSVHSANAETRSVQAHVVHPNDDDWQYRNRAMTDTQTRTLQVISEHAETNVSWLKGDYILSQTLGMDRDDIAEMNAALELEFGVHFKPRDFPHPLSTVDEIVAMVEGIRKQALEVK